MSRLSLSVRTALATLLFSLPWLPAVCQAQQPPEEPLRFDVVSIRPSSAAAKDSHINIGPNGYEALGVPLVTTLLMAYVPAPFFAHFDELKGYPAWVGSERYDIRAKLLPALAARWGDLRQNIAQTPTELQGMLRAALAERCKLRIHSAASKADAYTLRVQASSPALVESTALPPTEQVMQLPDGARAVFTTQDGQRTYEFFNTSMPVFAGFLGLQTSQAVVDQTGLPGRYHFTVHRAASTAPDAGPQADTPIPFDLSSIGLKASRTKVDTVTWVVDSIEKPTDN